MPRGQHKQAAPAPAGKAGFLEVAGPLVGLGGFGAWIFGSVARKAPGRYDPCQLPRDVFPE